MEAIRTPDVSHHSPSDDPRQPLRRRVKKAGEFLHNFIHPLRGVKVNYLQEPSFRAWLVLAIPFYAWGVKKRLALWRWMLMTIPFLNLLAGEMANTALEESVRSHRRETFHFRNAMDSSSGSVMIKALIALACALYALWGPDPWVKKTETEPVSEPAVTEEDREDSTRTSSFPSVIAHRSLNRSDRPNSGRRLQC